MFFKYIKTLFPVTKKAFNVATKHFDGRIDELNLVSSEENIGVTPENCTNFKVRKMIK